MSVTKEDRASTLISLPRALARWFLSNMGLGKELVTAALTGRHGGYVGLTGGERARLARNVYAVAKRPLFCNPFHLAVGLGLQLRPVSVVYPAPDFRVPRCVYYDWHLDKSETHLSVYHGIAQELLLDTGREYGDITACLFAAELALPENIARSTMLCQAARMQPHVPEWWLRARFMGFHRSGVTLRPVCLKKN